MAAALREAQVESAVARSTLAARPSPLLRSRLSRRKSVRPAGTHAAQQQGTRVLQRALSLEARLVRRAGALTALVLCQGGRTRRRRRTSRGWSRPAPPRSGSSRQRSQSAQRPLPPGPRAVPVGQRALQPPRACFTASSCAALTCSSHGRAYSKHTSRFLSVWLFSLPLVLVETMCVFAPQLLCSSEPVVKERISSFLLPRGSQRGGTWRLARS